MKVELDVFSGRPNPSWDLSLEEKTELARLVIDLRPVERALPDPGLGYRGFLLSEPSRQIRVYQGILTVTEHGATKHYADVRRIEHWLVEQAKARGYGDLVAGIADQSR